MRLVESGGRTSQDLGLGRIVGQILVYLYMQPSACPLDELEENLGLSKASVSIAARQLEQLGLVKRVWVKGERKKYYQSADNIGQALQHGLLSLILQKVDDFGDQLETTAQQLNNPALEDSEEAKFLRHRVSRSLKLLRRIKYILGNPLVRYFTTNDTLK